MFQQLTKYLLQYKRVSIPHVGTLQIMQHPPQLNVADKILLPPSFSAELRSEDSVPEHQLNYLAQALQEEKTTILRRLQELGSGIKDKVQNGGFEWKGVGTIKSDASFAIAAGALEPIPAERVIREDAQHSVLVGDRQMTSAQAADRLSETGTKKRSVAIIIAWVLLVLSILYIAFVLYTGKFKIQSTGLRLPLTGCMPSSKLLVHEG